MDQACDPSTQGITLNAAIRSNFIYSLCEIRAPVARPLGAPRPSHTDFAKLMETKVQQTATVPARDYWEISAHSHLSA